MRLSIKSILFCCHLSIFLQPFQFASIKGTSLATPPFFNFFIHIWALLKHQIKKSAELDNIKSLFSVLIHKNDICLKFYQKNIHLIRTCLVLLLNNTKADNKKIYELEFSQSKLSLVYESLQISTNIYSFFKFWQTLSGNSFAKVSN